MSYVDYNKGYKDGFEAGYSAAMQNMGENDVRYCYMCNISLAYIASSGRVCDRIDCPSYKQLDTKAAV